MMEAKHVSWEKRKWQIDDVIFKTQNAGFANWVEQIKRVQPDYWEVMVTFTVHLHSHPTKAIGYPLVLHGTDNDGILHPILFNFKGVIQIISVSTPPYKIDRNGLTILAGPQEFPNWREANHLIYLPEQTEVMLP